MPKPQSPPTREHYQSQNSPQKLLMIRSQELWIRAWTVRALAANWRRLILPGSLKAPGLGPTVHSCPSRPPTAVSVLTPSMEALYRSTPANPSPSIEANQPEHLTNRYEPVRAR